MFSLLHIGILSETDIVVQLAACTFDAHIQEILGSLIFSATVVMLQPQGNMDFVYVTQTLQDKQVTYMLNVPSYLDQLCNIIKNCNICSRASIRTLCCVGK
jgi:non-ribosomal peptide synthetase component F